ncbi:uncharacterized protein ACHE_80029S [Aspergillus chevalieri]|uniref:Uncharacterized protein n=1 Tax=Aspergillus chevalieri TaxID=182096 RepID=A0A7R7VWK3_ASPCH|nr:uncharacterized protein ACHE_80029S [Aspergillus chevalieri]BCR92129.1 hypothetical protein ACHE_80029S [Aspergillus chevalieri]
MAKHHSSDKCSATVRVPPMGVHNVSQAVAFTNDHTKTLKYQICCGVDNQLIIYNKNCFKFCDTPTNQTEVLSCIKDAGVTKVEAYNSSQESNDDTSAAIPVSTNMMSKSAIGLAAMMVLSMAVGTL